MSIIQMLFTSSAAPATLQGYPGAGDASIILDYTTTLSSNPPFTLESGVTIQIDSTGTARYQYFDSNTGTTNFTTYTWLLSGSASDVYVKMDNPSSGAFSLSSATGSWLQLNAARAWTVRASGVNPGTYTGSATSTIYLGNSTGSVIYAQKTVQMDTQLDLI